MIPYTVLAHSWGWDELAYFAVPITLALVWVRWIEKRAKARKEAGAAAESDETAAAETPPTQDQ